MSRQHDDAERTPTRDECLEAFARACAPALRRWKLKQAAKVQATGNEAERKGRDAMPPERERLEQICTGRSAGDPLLLIDLLLRSVKPAQPAGRNEPAPELPANVVDLNSYRRKRKGA